MVSVVAVCLVGQLRTGAYLRVQENIARALEGLSTDVFAFVSRRHEIAHAAGPGGCLRETTGVCIGGGGRATSRQQRVGKWGSRRADTTWAEIEAFRTAGPLRPVVVDVSEDARALARASALNESRGELVQKALRARCRLCYEAVVRRERETGRTYDAVMRLRPDYVFDCRVPSSFPLSTWAVAHRDYWELMSRDLAGPALEGLWVDAAERLVACRPAEGSASEKATRVESCAYFALCAAGADVRAADVFYDTKFERLEARRRRRVEGLPPASPGTIVRPCCDDNATHGKLLLPPPTKTCLIDHDPVLGKWVLGSVARQGQPAWDRLRNTLLLDLGPRCRERLPPTIPPPPGDDDDDDDDDQEDDRAPVRDDSSSRDELRRR